MRPIEFRGITKGSDYMIYGYLSVFNKAHYVNSVYVDSKTIGQYIGIKAEYKEEKKIFEGDIIRNKYTQQLYVVKWVGVGFKLMDYACNYHDFFDSFSMEIAGNIHQNKEMLNYFNG